MKKTQDLGYVTVTSCAGPSAFPAMGQSPSSHLCKVRGLERVIRSHSSSIWLVKSGDKFLFLPSVSLIMRAGNSTRPHQAPIPFLCFLGLRHNGSSYFVAKRLVIPITIPGPSGGAQRPVSFQYAPPAQTLVPPEPRTAYST